MSRRLVLVLVASAAIAAGLLLAACGGGRQGHQRQGRRRQLRRHRVLGQRPPRQADRLRPAAAGRLGRALQADERRDRPGDGAQGLAGRQHRGRLPGLRRLPGLDRRVGREPLPVQRRRLRRRPRRDRRDRHLQLRLRAGHDPDPEQGARRRPADGLARQHPGLPDRAGLDLQAERAGRLLPVGHAQLRPGGPQRRRADGRARQLRQRAGDPQPVHPGRRRRPDQQGPGATPSRAPPASSA